MKIVCFLLVACALRMAGGDLDKLQGTWLTVSLVNDGKILVSENTPPAPGPVTKLVYKGNIWTVMVGDKAVAAGVIKIDAMKSPKEIDLLDDTGMRNEKSKLAIYDLDGDVYRYCIAPAGKPRPAKFTSDAGSGNTLAVSKREKQ